MQDLVVTIPFLTVNCLLVRGAWQLSTAVFPKDLPFDRIIQTIILSWACIVTTSIVLGLWGVLSGVSLLIGVATLVLVLFPILRKRLAVPLARTEIAIDARGQGEGWWLPLWGVCLAYALGSLIFDGTLSFPRNWDTLTYHLPLVVQWLRQGSLYAPDDASWANPGNNELLGFWLVAPFSGDFLIAFNNVPSILLLCAAAVQLTRVLGLQRGLSHISGLCTVATWPLLMHLTDCENDIAVVATFLASLYFGVRVARSGRIADMVFASLSLGLLTGVKYYATGYALVACTGVFLTTWFSQGRRAGLRCMWTFSLGILLCACYWYVRNFYFTGTPFYPKGYTAANDVTAQIHSGVQAFDVWRTTLLGNSKPEVFPGTVSAIWRLAGPWHILVFLGFPSVVAWLAVFGVWLQTRPETQIEGTIRLMLAYSMVGSSIVWGIIPFAVETNPGTLNMLRSGYSPIRFGLSFLSIASVGLAVMLHDLLRVVGVFLEGKRVDSGPRGFVFSLTPVLSQAAKYLPHVAVGIVLFYQISLLLLRPVRESSLSFNMLGGSFALASIVAIMQCWERWHRVRPLVWISLIVVLAASALWGTSFLAERWHRDFAANYDRQFGGKLFSMLSEMDPESTRICVLGYRYYPYFGSRRQFPAARPLWVPSYPDLLLYLRAHDTTYVSALLDDKAGIHRYEGKSKWLLNHSDLFFPVENGPHYLFCRIRAAQTNNDENLQVIK